jgi:hypothetical protein
MAKVVHKNHTDKQFFNSYNWWFIALSGAALGVITLVLAWLIGSFVLDPLLCRVPEQLDACGKSGDVAGNIASVIAAVGGIFILIRLRVLRTLLIAFAVIVSFWGIHALIANLPWGEAAAWMAGVYALGYVLFAWLFRIRSIIIACIAAIIAVLIIRLVAFL